MSHVRSLCLRPPASPLPSTYRPDGVQRGLVGEIIARFEKRGFKLVALKLATPSKEHLEQHYADLKDKPFFPSLIKYMLSGPVVCMVWEGLGELLLLYQVGTH